MIYHINPSLLSFSFADIISERKKGDEKEDGRTFETRLSFSFFLYIRREQTIEDTNSLEKQRVCLGEICNSSALCFEEVYIAEDDSFGGGGEIFSINDLPFDSSSGFKVHSRRNRAFKQASPKRQVCLLHARKGRLQREQSEKR